MKSRFIHIFKSYKEKKRRIEEEDRKLVYEVFDSEEANAPCDLGDEFDEEMQKKLKEIDKLEELRMQEKKMSRQILLKQAAAVLIICLSIVYVSGIGTNANPLSFMQFFIDKVGEDIVDLEQATENKDKTDIVLDNPEFRLDGFELVSNEVKDGNIRISYENGDGKRYILTSEINKYSLDLDIEGSEYSRKKINNYECFYSYKEETRFLKWFMGDWEVGILGNITFDEMVSVAELIQNSNKE